MRHSYSKIHLVNLKNIPGPGSYDLNKINKSCIIYSVSTIRVGSAWSLKGGREKVSTFEENIKWTPGPGAYLIEGEIGDANVYKNIYIRPVTSNNDTMNTPIKFMSSYSSLQNSSQKK